MSITFVLLCPTVDHADVCWAGSKAVFKLIAIEAILNAKELLVPPVHVPCDLFTAG